ncbi:MAG TPA: CPBP family intramembrane glutamic endopeptidase [Chryseosolibacter sp.]|nr:CPBP family intramembrane glutamic endopeptidase [Chryseosolibacter sp.]
MSDLQPDNKYSRHPLLSLLLILLMVGLGFVIVGPTVGFIFAMPFYDGSMMDMLADMQAVNDPAIKLPLYITQGFATFIGLIVVPVLYLNLERKSLAILFTKVEIDIVPIILTIVLVVVFMGVNSVFIDWNSSFEFPEFAKNFERWAREKEDIAAEMTAFLTQFDSIFEVAIAMIVIAVLPAVGEEIVFRGIIQNLFQKLTQNYHVSIWLAAILFSAIHLQFFGFVPRLLLGALFGYLYYWSGNIILPMMAHFVNNGFSVLALYFYQQGTVDYNLEEPEAVPLNVVAICTVLATGILYYFYKYYQRKTFTNPL